MEYGARLVADQTKLSSRFGQIQDLLIEADYWARKGGGTLITEEYVKKALDEKIYRLKSLSHRPVGGLSNTGVGAMRLNRGWPVQLHRPLVGPQKGRLLS